MTSETESEIKSLKEELQCIEKEMLTAISICDAAQSTNQYMCVATSEKNLVSSLDIRYSVFFLWEAKKLLQQKLSIPFSTYCQLVNSSVSCSSIVPCERLETRLETRLKKESSRILSRYKTLKGQHRSLFKAKNINILLFEGETPESSPARLQISGYYIAKVAIASQYIAISVAIYMLHL